MQKGGRPKLPVREGVKRAVELLQRCPNLTIPEAMLGCGEFTKFEAANKSDQMRIRRHLNDIEMKKKKIPNTVGIGEVPPASPLTTSSTGCATVAGVLLQSESSSGAPSAAATSCEDMAKSNDSVQKAETKLFKMAGVIQNHCNGGQAQNRRTSKTKINNLQKRAFEEATTIYAAEKTKMIRPRRLGSSVII